MIWPFRRRRPAPHVSPQELLRAIMLDERVRDDAEQIARDFRRVLLSTQEGRRVLASLLNWCGMYDPRPVPTDPAQCQRWAAARDIGMSILTAVYADAEPMPIQPEDNR